MCINIWRCFATDEDNDEYDDDQHNIIEKIKELLQKINQRQIEPEEIHVVPTSSHEEIKSSFGTFIDLFVSYSWIQNQ